MFRRRFHERLTEDLDAIANTSKEDKLMILSMTSKVLRPTGKEEIRQWLKNIVRSSQLH
jgi:hypothetical protein